MSATLARCECCGADLTMGDPDTRCIRCEEDRAVWKKPSRGLLARLAALVARSGPHWPRAVRR